MARHDRQPRARRWISRRQRLILAATTAVVVAVVVGYFAYRAAANLPGVLMPDQGNLHIPTADSPHEPYNSDPPTSGPHRSEEHTSELQSLAYLVCRLLLEKKKNNINAQHQLPTY